MERTYLHKFQTVVLNIGLSQAYGGLGLTENEILAYLNSRGYKILSYKLCKSTYKGKKEYCIAVQIIKDNFFSKAVIETIAGDLLQECIPMWEPHADYGAIVWNEQSRDELKGSMIYNALLFKLPKLSKHTLLISKK